MIIVHVKWGQSLEPVSLGTLVWIWALSISAVCQLSGFFIMYVHEKCMCSFYKGRNR